MIGTCGLCGCSTIEIPVAKNDSPSKFSWDFIAGLTGPCTAENATPPFSNNSPSLMTRVNPPPPSVLSQLSEENVAFPSNFSNRSHKISRILSRHFRDWFSLFWNQRRQFHSPSSPWFTFGTRNKFVQKAPRTHLRNWPKKFPHHRKTIVAQNPYRLL